MTMTTERHCETLGRVSKVQMIRAIHEAHLQLSAVNRDCDLGYYDCNPALAALFECLRDAGHMGYVSDGVQS